MTMRRIGTYLYDELEERHMVDPGISITGSLSGPLGIGDDAMAPLYAAVSPMTIILPPYAYAMLTAPKVRRTSRGWRRHVRRQKAMDRRGPPPDLPDRDVPGIPSKGIHSMIDGQKGPDAALHADAIRPHGAHRRGRADRRGISDWEGVLMAQVAGAVILLMWILISGRADAGPLRYRGMVRG